MVLNSLITGSEGFRARVRELESLETGKERVVRIHVYRVRNDGRIVEIGRAADEVASASRVHDDKADDGIAGRYRREDHSADRGAFRAHLSGHGAGRVDRENVDVELRIGHG